MAADRGRVDRAQRALLAARFSDLINAALGAKLHADQGDRDGAVAQLDALGRVAAVLRGELAMVDVSGDAS